MRELEIMFTLKIFNSKPISEIDFGQERSCRRGAVVVVRAIKEEM